MRAFAVFVACAACGRVGFDARVDGAPGQADDAAALAAPCVSGAVPDDIVISGQTFRYTDFNNNTEPVPFSGVAAFEPDLLALITQTISLSDGTYALTIPTTSGARPAALLYTQAGDWTTMVISDRPYAADLAGPNMSRWRLGDGPLWDDGSMGSVYGTLGATLDSDLGTLSITARTCGGEVAEGVTFEVDPPPATAGYLAANGIPSTVATSTMSPYTQWIAFNVEPGKKRIRATRAGVAFSELDVIVVSGQNIAYVVMHVLD